MKKIALLIGLLVTLAATQGMAAFTEPTMDQYTAYPVIGAETTPPNIMVILDNSGSMNFNAYGDYPTYSNGSVHDGGTVTTLPFQGEPYAVITHEFTVATGTDDMEENGGNPYNDTYDLDLGAWAVGLRFQNVDLPQGEEIVEAYIEFTAVAGSSTNTSLTIDAEDTDDAPVIDAGVANDITLRTGTSASVTWQPSAWTTGDRGANTTTADISSIVQELVNRSGWAEGNAMLFRFTGSGVRYATPGDSDPAAGPVLRIVTYGISDDGPKTKYYGYFNTDYFYKYNASEDKFKHEWKKVAYNLSGGNWTVKSLDGSSTSTKNNSAIVSEGLWDGNFLNWLTMRRIDVLRKVLFGGDAGTNGRDGSGVQTLYGEHPLQTSRKWYRDFDSTLAAVSPYLGNQSYYISGGQFKVGGVWYDIHVEKNIAYDPQDFFEYDNGDNLAGVMQRIGDQKARWGNAWFHSSYNGGYIDHYIGSDMVTLVKDMQAKGCDTSTPLAETFYVAMQYFRQKSIGVSGYDSHALPNATAGDSDDPWYVDGELVPCAKAFTILLTDGASNSDGSIPSDYKDFDGDDNSGDTCTNCESDALDDLALWAHTQDLRSDLEGENITLYTIYAFDNDPGARQLLKDAARNGGFEDRNIPHNKMPDGDYDDPPEDRLEWDENRDGDPDTYFEATDGFQLEIKLLHAIADIMDRASSGTASSVLATNTKGAGSSLQAFFRPLVTDKDTGEEARWLGYLQTLWTDPWGNLREDTNGNLKLDLYSSGDQNAADSNVDKIVEIFTDEDTGDTKVKRYTSHYLYNASNGDTDACMVADCSTIAEEVFLEEIVPLFEVGKRLAERDLSALPRSLYTYLDKNQNNVVDSGEWVTFDADTASHRDAIKPYLGVRDGSYWGDFGSTHDDRAANLITWVRGVDQIGMRDRTIDNETWRLGDIINSTPIVVSSPSEYFQQLYRDEDYLNFIQYAKDRETMIYVGANDGMLHAFTNWKYQEELASAYETTGTPTYVQPASAVAGEQIGEELWAYIPQSLLPHLKWQALIDYTHTFYVDAEVRVFDAKILPNGTYYPGVGNNYGTFLVVGLNLGGKEIDVNEDFDGDGSPEVRSFAPTYTMLDVTDPRNPKLMWERSYSGLGFSTTVPAPMRVGDQWYLVFGSGPTSYDGWSDQKAHCYVVDMATGAPVSAAAGGDWVWESDESNAYTSSTLALDVFKSYNSDALYFAKNYYDSSTLSWKADVHKVTVPCSTCPWDSISSMDDVVYNPDPDDWYGSTLFKSDRPVSIKLGAATDPLDNVMLFFGTGRYLNGVDMDHTDADGNNVTNYSDLADSSQNYLYGIKDPFYNREKYDGKNGSYYHKFGGTPLSLERANLFESDSVEVTTSGHVTGYPASGSTSNFDAFVTDVRMKEDGWYLSLNPAASAGEPSERIITEAAVLGGIVLLPAFTPSVEICDKGGETSYLGVYYETGTGYKRQLFDIDTANIRTGSITMGSETNTEEFVEIRDDDKVIGNPPPKVPLHAGSEGGARAKPWNADIEINPALYFKSITTEWWDDPSSMVPQCSWEQ
jgi:type IV pilus assembly protein PilY1